MSKKRQSEDAVPSVWIADAVRPHHANTFVEEWFRHSRESGAMWEAFAATALMHWPSEDDRLPGEPIRQTPAQARYGAIEDEILQRMVNDLRPAVMEAFTRAATAVLDRERNRR